MGFVARSERDLWVYHKEQTPKIIKAIELDNHLKEGWNDNPSEFVNYEDVGIDRNKIKEGDTKERMKADQILQTIAAVAARLNDSINLEHMRKGELQEFALTHFDYELKRQKTIKQMINKIRGLMSDDS